MHSQQGVPEVLETTRHSLHSVSLRTVPMEEMGIEPVVSERAWREEMGVEVVVNSLAWRQARQVGVRVLLV